MNNKRAWNQAIGMSVRGYQRYSEIMNRWREAYKLVHKKHPPEIKFVAGWYYITDGIHSSSHRQYEIIRMTDNLLRRAQHAQSNADHPDNGTQKQPKTSA